VLITELVYRFAQRGEPVIYVTTDRPPIGLYQQFRSLGWDFHKLVEEEKIQIIDAFSGLVEEDTMAFKKLSPLNTKISKQMKNRITLISD